MKDKVIYPSIILMFLLILWEWAVRWFQIPPLILPAPTAIGESLIRHTLSGYLLKHTGVTLVEIMGGFVLGAILGIGLGVLVSQSVRLHRILNPYIIASQTMPKLALAPLFGLWFGYGFTPKILIAALISFFPLFESTVTGLTFIPKEQLDLFRSLRATKWQTLVKLRIPHSLPYLFSGFRIAIVLSIVGAVVGEFVGANAGLGALILVSQGMMDTPLMFAVFFLLTLIGLLLYQLFVKLEQLIRPDYSKKRGKRQWKL
jgi:NitT/TauT family transport system permease protein